LEAHARSVEIRVDRGVAIGDRRSSRARAAGRRAK
jgi:hypothetical protein